MKILLNGPSELLPGILLTTDLLDLRICDRDPDLTIDIFECAEVLSSFEYAGNHGTIRYGGGKTRFFRAFAGLLLAFRSGGPGARSERPLFKDDGPMLDVSRNAVLRPETVKEFILRTALMGMNTFMLYTEDTYTVPERPYFGYMRGRYSVEELRELNDFAEKLGVELIPCIQVLGHLATALRWQANGDVRDTADVLLEGEEKTYELIRQMLESVRSSFSSNRICIGMDETHDLGLGAHLARFGYEKKQEIYFRHLNRVAKIAGEFGFHAMIWSDMFFRMAGQEMKLSRYSDYDLRVELPDNIGENIPGNITPIFWDYYNADENFYLENLKKHRKFGRELVFAGGIWCWGGFAPQFSRSFRNSLAALRACKSEGADFVISTVWHNGSEAGLPLSIALLALYADFDYRGEYDPDGVDKTLFAASAEHYENLIIAEEVEYPEPGNRDHGSSRPILYNDPLTGLFDRQLEGTDLQNYYKECTDKLARARKFCGSFTNDSMTTLLRLSRLLEKKADFGLRLKNAYDQRNNLALELLAEECDEVQELIRDLRKAHQAQWMHDNKPFGWEVHDLRYGALLMRFETIKDRLRDYLAGKIHMIEELEEERLLYMKPVCDQKLVSDWSTFGPLFSANII